MVALQDRLDLEALRDKVQREDDLKQFLQKDHRVTIEQLNRMHQQLDQAAAAYLKKYGTLPDGIKTGVRWQIEHY